MDFRHIQFVLFLFVLPNSGPVQSNLPIYDPQLTQNVTSTSNQHTNTNAAGTLPKSQTLSSYSSKVLQNITTYSKLSQDVISPKATDGLSILIQLLQTSSLKASDTLSNKTKTSSTFNISELILETSLESNNSKTVEEDGTKPSLDLLFTVSEEIQKTSTKSLNILSNNYKIVENNGPKPVFDILFNVSDEIPKTFLKILSNNSKILKKERSRPLFDLISNMSKVIPSSAALDLRSNTSDEQTKVNSSSLSLVYENANGTILRRQSGPKYNDILYSKPPNRYYAFQVPTYKEGATYTSVSPELMKFNNSCDIEAYYCLKVYLTGVVCARTLYYIYHSFPNVCLMEYTNCFLHANEWHIMYMGHCVNLSVHDYPYQDNSYLSKTRILEDANSLPIDLY